jgi:3-methyladenine DNA glycosylase/8-oxoguanine DNA glycosylase
MKDSVKSEEAQHDFAAKALTDAVKRCEKSGVSTEITVQTLLSVGATLLLSSCGADDAASMLEGMAAAIRSGEITRDDA